MEETYNKKKVDKLLEELWDNKNISSSELQAIKQLLTNTEIDFNRRWNILKLTNK